MDSKTVYFENVGPENTEPTFALVKERMKDLGIKKLVLASTTGDTASQAMEFFRGTEAQLVVVPHQFDFSSKTNRFPQELVRKLTEAGHRVYFGTMLFHTENLYGSTIPTLMANLLRCFSQGVKVCFEIVMMATDGGLLASGEQVIAVAGSGRGSDTAMVMQAASSRSFKNLRANQIICKPLNLIKVE